MPIIFPPRGLSLPEKTKPGTASTTGTGRALFIKQPPQITPFAGETTRLIPRVRKPFITSYSHADGEEVIPADATPPVTPKSNTKKYLIWAAIAVAGYFLWKKYKK